MRKCGIYCIENIVTHQKYIGQSVDINRRKSAHINALRKGTHINQYLQNSWNKYHEYNFKFYILEICPLKYLDDREIWNISYWNTINKEYGFNRESGGNLHKHASQETRNKISKSHLNRHDKQTQERIAHRSAFREKAVICLTTNEIFKSATQAQKTYPSAIGIYRSCTGHHTYCGTSSDGTPLRWAYYQDYINGNLPNHRVGYYQHTKKVCVFDRNFNLLDICNSSVEVAKKYNVSETAVRSCNLGYIPYLYKSDLYITICQEELENYNIPLTDKIQLRNFKQKQYNQNKIVKKQCKCQGKCIDCNIIYDYIAQL